MPKRILYFLAVILVTLLSLGVRLYAANRLDVDYDEPVYLSTAVSYAKYMRQGDFKMLAWGEENFEHPVFYKILYGVVLLTHQPLDRLPDKDLPRQAPIAATAAGPWNVVDRYFSVLLGTLAVLALAVFNPLAGLFLAISTLSVKYTSEVYLEALPVLSSLLCALAYGRWFAAVSREPAAAPRHGFWLALSAAFLGMTAASKYIYCVVGMAIGIHFMIGLLQKQIPARFAYYIGSWAVLSLFMFFVFDPYLWPHPLGRLLKSVTFHESFQGSRLVQQYHYPFWQPFRWLVAFSTYYDLHPRQAFLFDIDTLIFALAIVGLPALFQKVRLFFYWLIIGLIFLLLWQTKWPQYTLIVLAPLSLSAAYGVLTLSDLAKWLLVRNRQPSAAM
jgi:hypothetical protein